MTTQNPTIITVECTNFKRRFKMADDRHLWSRCIYFSEL